MVTPTTINHLDDDELGRGVLSKVLKTYFESGTGVRCAFQRRFSSYKSLRTPRRNRNL